MNESAALKVLDSDASTYDNRQTDDYNTQNEK